MKRGIARINQLWDCMRAGDAAALQELYNTFYQYLFASGFSFCMHRDLTKDSIHDAFVNIWVNRDKIPPVTSVGGYLRMCVRRKIIDALKKEQLVESSISKEDDAPEYSYAETIIAFQEEQRTKEALERALSHLTNKQKEVIRLRFFENRNYEEIAQMLDSEPRTIYNHMHVAMSQLRHHLSFRYTL